MDFHDDDGSITVNIEDIDDDTDDDKDDDTDNDNEIDDDGEANSEFNDIILLANTINNVVNAFNEKRYLSKKFLSNVIFRKHNKDYNW